MGLPEGFTITHRDQIQDQAMRNYRQIMAPIWFAGDLASQSEYINLPGNPTCGNVTQNQCLTHEGHVKGTISIYSFKYLNNKTLKTSAGECLELTNLPGWIMESGYIGDNSIATDIEGQGLMTTIVKEIMEKFPHAFLIGITGELNVSMKKVFEKTGAAINNHSPYFVKPRNPRELSKEIGNYSLEHVPTFSRHETASSSSPVSKQSRTTSMWGNQYYSKLSQHNGFNLRS